MFCSKCGNEIADDAVLCSRCGNIVKSGHSEEDNNPLEVDRGGFKWGLLGFMFFQAGLALYFVYRVKKPRRAKAIQIGMIVGICLKVVFWIFYGAVISAVAADLYEDLGII